MSGQTCDEKSEGNELGFISTATADECGNKCLANNECIAALFFDDTTDPPAKCILQKICNPVTYTGRPVREISLCFKKE